MQKEMWQNHWQMLQNKKNGEETERFQERTDAEKLIMSIKIWPHEWIVNCEIFKGTVMQIM